MREASYPYVSGASGQSWVCKKDKLEGLAEKVQLTGGGYVYLKQWSKTALKEASGGCKSRELLLI